MMEATGNFITVDVFSDSILKYLQSGDGVDVNLTAIPGAKISDITNAIYNVGEPDIVVIHVGTNDLSDPKTTMEGVRNQFMTLFQKVRFVYNCPVIFSGILPREDRPDLEPLRIAVNHLIGSLATNQMIYSNGEFSFKSWDEDCSGDFFFSIDGLHPSRRGNRHLHCQLRKHLMWIMSGDRDISRKIVGSMISRELERTRIEARRLHNIKMEIKQKKNKNSENQSREQARTAKSWPSKFTQSVHRRTPKQPRDRSYRADSVINVAGCPVICPRVSGWGLRTRRNNHPAKVSDKRPRVQHVISTSVIEKDVPVACPFCLQVMADDDLLDHYLQTHHHGNGEEIESEMSTGKEVGGGRFVKTRGECATIQFSTRPHSVQQVRQVDEGECLDDSFFVNVSKLSSLPPLSQLQQINNQLIRLNKIKGQQHFVEFNSGQKYSVKEIKDAIMCHKLKDVGRDVTAEKAWIDSPYDLINAESPLSNKLIQDYCDIIFNNPPETNIPLHGDVISVEDLAALTRTSWLSNFLLMFYAGKLQRQSSNVKFRFVSDVETFSQTVSSSLSSCDLSNNNMRLIFYSLVNSNGASTTLGQGGNHFVFSAYFLDCNELVYADPLGGQIPEHYIHQFRAGLRLAGLDSNSLLVTFCHDPLSRNQSNCHKCSNNCASCYPLQTCSSICGVAAIVGMTIAALSPKLFKIMTHTGSTDTQAINKVKYLQKISHYSAFLRRVVINWILSEEIDLYILICKKTNVMPQCTQTEEEEENCISSDNKCNSLLSFVSDHCLKSGTSLDESETGKEIHLTNGLVCNIRILELLQKDPKVSYRSKNSRLVLQMFPMGTESQIVKKVTCNELKSEDVEAIKMLNGFLQSDECMNRIKKLGNGKRVIKEDQYVYWEQIEDVRVGQDMKHYFDKFLFDIVKVFKIEKTVSSVYQKNNTTLKVSVTENLKWGQTHRLDETYKFICQKKPAKCTAVVKLYVYCSSTSSECRAQCGNLLKSINTQKGVTTCSGCGKDLEQLNTCAHCNTTDTPNWYKYKTSSTCTDTICNACYRHIRKHNTIRPHCRTQPAHNKIHHPHLACDWKMKCVIFSDDIDTWKIFVSDKNQTIHRNQPCQQRKRPCLSDRDEIDRLIKNKQ